MHGHLKGIDVMTVGPTGLGRRKLSAKSRGIAKNIFNCEYNKLADLSGFFWGSNYFVIFLSTKESVFL